MTYDFLVIGSSGMQGRIVTRDLLESGYKVHCADLYKEGSEENIHAHPGTPFSFLDLRDLEAVRTFCRQVGAKVIVNCAEGDWNLDVYRVALDVGCHVMDLGSDIPMSKDQFALSNAFKKAGKTAVTGCGSTPGINNVMMKHASQFFSAIDTIEIGFNWDSNIKKFAVPFSMESIIEELADPAPVLENGVWLEKNPRDTEVVREVREIGAQKCYLVRHPETWTFTEDYKHLSPKNIRFYAGFPDHCLDVLRTLIALGMGSKKRMKFEQTEIRPVDALARTLTRLGKPEGYTEKENLWVEISGTGTDGSIKLMRMECIVSTLPGWTEAGCNIDTGFPASIIAQMLLDGRITARGSFAPDACVPTDLFFGELKKKGMTVFQDGQAIN